MFLYFKMWYTSVNSLKVLMFFFCGESLFGCHVYLLLSFQSEICCMLGPLLNIYLLQNIQNLTRKNVLFYSDLRNIYIHYLMTSSVNWEHDCHLCLNKQNFKYYFHLVSKTLCHSPFVSQKHAHIY